MQYYNTQDFNLDLLQQPSSVPHALSIPDAGVTKMGVRAAVKPDRISLRSIVGWQGKGDNPFYHEKEVGEDWLFRYPAKIHCGIGGVWGKRTPILHPAVAAVDATQAGIDDAYLRAMQNVDLMVGGGRREDAAGHIRTLVTRYARITYNPAAFLTRAAALYTVLVLKEHGGAGLSEAEWDRYDAAPRRISDINTFAGVCAGQLKDSRDVIYLRLEEASEVPLIQVMLALANATFPVETDHALRQLWPRMSNPCVVYTSPVHMPALSTRINSEDVADAMARYCDVFDCHDMWADALGLAQAFTSRPAGAGVLAGTHNISVDLPPSDLRIGAIGPLLAGVSAEGMRTQAFDIPSPADFLYAGAVRGAYVTAAYYESIKSVRDSHPALLAFGKANSAKHRALGQAATAHSLMSSRASAVAADAGWGCFNDFVNCVHPTWWRSAAKELFRPDKVPWWTNVIGHMGKAADRFLANWARPAHLREIPVPRQWYSFSTLGATTNDQVASAVRWLGARVMYTCVQLPRGLMTMDVKTGSINRFLPDLTPTIMLEEGGKLNAALIFDKGAVSGVKFVQQLSAADVVVLPHHDEDVGTVAVDDNFGGLEFDTKGVDPWYAKRPDSPTGTASGPLDEVIIEQHDAGKVQEGAQGPVEQTGMSTMPVDEAVKVLQDCHVHNMLKGEPIKEAFEGKNTNGAHTQASVVNAINGELLIREASTPDNALLRARALLSVAESLLRLPLRGDILTSMARQRNFATNAVASLSRVHGDKKTWAELTEEEDAAAALGESALNTPSPAVAAAPDDPEGEGETLEDFGGATSGLGSGTAPPRAAGVVPTSQELPTLGFYPPGPSSVSE